MPKKVVLGEVNLKSKNSNSRFESSIAQVIIHPNYQKRASHDDIALVRLANKVNLHHGRRASIRPACVSRVEVPETEKATATGWGLLKFFGGED